jgi:hypothetical protein
MANVVIVDIDGICFDPIERLNRCRKQDGKIDWARAFSNEEVIRDPIIPGASKAVYRISYSFAIIYLTGRSYKCEIATLRKN